MFGFCVKKENQYNKWINRVSGYSFGMYLFQTHMVFRPYIWEKMFRFSTVSESSYLYAHEALLCVLVILGFTMITEEIRKKLFSCSFIKRPKDKLADICDRLYYHIIV